MTALELFLIACVILMIALAAYFFLQTRKAIAEREQYYKEHADRKRGRVSLAPQWPEDSGGGE